MINDDFATYRAREFEWTARAIYLNAAGFGPLPERTRRAVNDFNDKRNRIQLRETDLIAALGAARENAARLINCQTDEIALAPNTNAGVNLAANAVLERADQRDLRAILVRLPRLSMSWRAARRNRCAVRGDLVLLTCAANWSIPSVRLPFRITWEWRTRSPCCSSSVSTISGCTSSSCSSPL